jgi:hypothetical protein
VDGTDKLREGAKVEIGNAVAGTPAEAGSPKHGKRRHDGEAPPPASSS